MKGGISRRGAQPVNGAYKAKVARCPRNVADSQKHAVGDSTAADLSRNSFSRWMR